MTQTCENCFYFLKTGENTQRQTLIGYCRAEPPQHLFDHETGKPKIAQFPVVISNMWCGMWDERS